MVCITYPATLLHAAQRARPCSAREKRLYSVRGFPDVCRVLFFFFFSARAGSECTYVCLIDDTLRQQSREIMISVDQTPEYRIFSVKRVTDISNVRSLTSQLWLAVVSL